MEKVQLLFLMKLCILLAYLVLIRNLFINICSVMNLAQVSITFIDKFRCSVCCTQPNGEVIFLTAEFACFLSSSLNSPQHINHLGFL